MSSHDLPPNQQTLGKGSPIRERLLNEIADVPPPSPPAEQVPETAEECGSHPFSDLNVTSFARQVDSLFLFRWLEGLECGKKAPLPPLCTRPIPPAMQSTTDTAP